MGGSCAAPRPLRARGDYGDVGHVLRRWPGTTSTSDCVAPIRRRQPTGVRCVLGKLVAEAEHLLTGGLASQATRRLAMGIDASDLSQRSEATSSWCSSPGSPTGSPP